MTNDNAATNPPTTTILHGDALQRLQELPSKSVHCVVTSPPYYGLRDYGVEGQIGLEQTPEEYVQKLVAVFRQVHRVLKDDGTLWLNLGDSYAASGRGGGGGSFQDKDKGTKVSEKNSRRVPVAGFKPKDLIGIPWRVAFALQADGWYLRSDIIWHKPNPMPESVKDRPTRSHEYIFLLTKSQQYYYDEEAIKEPSVYWDKRTRRAIYKDARSYDGKHSDKQRGHGRRHAGFNERWDRMSKEEQGSNGRNKRDVWTVATRPFPEAHFAVFPEELIIPCVLAGCPRGGVVLDPFMGSGTTGIVAKSHRRNFVGIELNSLYINIARKRITSFSIDVLLPEFLRVTLPSAQPEKEPINGGGQHVKFGT